MSSRTTRPNNSAPAVMTRGKRLRIAKGECTDGLSCGVCQNEIPMNADHVVLNPCLCIICTRCLVNRHAERGSFALSCPCCNTNNSKVTSHRYHSARVPDPDDIRYTECPYEGEPTEEEIKNSRPKEYLGRKLGQEGLDKLEVGESIAVLYAYRLKKVADGERPKIIRYIDTISQHIETDQDMEAYCNTIAELMAFLHELITQPSIMKKKDVPTLMPRDIVDYCVERYKVSPLLSAIYSLATGYKSPEMDKVTLAKGDFVDYQSQFLALSLAEGLMLRSISKYPGPFQLMLMEQLSQESISQPRLNLLSALRILPSRTFTDKTKCKELIDAWTKDTTNTIDPLDLHIINQDNVGMQEKSKQATNVQYTIFQDIVVPKATLFKLGIYGENRLSRKKNANWKDLCSSDKEKTLAKSLIGVTDEAKQYHSEFIMEDIHATISLCMSGDIPVKEGEKIPRLGRIVPPDIKDALTSSQTSQSTDTIPPSTRPIRSLPNPSESESNSKIGGSGSMYKTEDANITLFARQQNLASDLVLETTAAYSSNVRKKQLEEYDGEDEVPIAQDMTVIMCDGAPCAQYYKILAEDHGEDGEKRYPTLMVFFGGFHTLMKLANCNGELFGNLLSTFLVTWRDSVPKQDWFLSPTDPDQREDETPSHTSAHYAAAVRALHESMGRWPSANEVNEHMMKRAKLYPICALTLLFLRCEVILKMLRASEKLGKRGCVKLFFNCLKLAVPIFAVTHKTDYMRLVCDIMQWHRCASDAENEIHKELIFTQVTSFGKSIFADLAMEETIGQIRAQCGRTFRRGTSAKIEQACENIPKHMNQGNIMDGLRTGGTADNTKKAKSKQTFQVHDDNPINRCLPKIEEMKLWHFSEAPEFDNIKLSEGDARLPGGEEVSMEVLDLYSIGQKRTHEYFQYYNIDHPGNTSRSEKEVSLRRVLPSKKERKSVLEKDIMAATSTDKKKLDTLVKDELMIQIEETIKTLNSKGVDPAIKREKKSGNKSDKIKRLIELRGIYFAMDKGAKEREKKEIERRYEESSKSFGTNICGILEDPMGLYAIHPTVQGKSRYSSAPDLDEQLDYKSFAMM